MPRKVKYDQIDERKINDICTEIFVFVLFLICTNIVADSMGYKYTYYNNELPKTLLENHTINFEHIKTIENMFDFITVTYLHNLYDNLILTEEPNKARPHMVFKNMALVLGAPRIRQIRVKPMRKCLHKIKIENLSKIPCYPEYSVSIDDDSSHDGHYITDANKILTNSHIYKGGGFSKMFHSNYNDSLDMMNYIYDSRWIDRATRLVVLELNLFYDATEMFQLVKIIFEIFPTGIVVSSWYVQSIPLKCFLHFGCFVFYVGIIFYLIIIYYTYQEFCEIFTFGIKSYVKDLQNYPDILLLLTSFVAIAYNIWHPFEVKLITDTFDKEPWTYINLDNLLGGWNVYVINMGILTFFTWLKTIRFLSFHRTLKRLAITIKLSFKYILGLLFIFTITILAFAQMGTILFGNKLENFKSIFASTFNIMRIVMCNFDYMSMHEVQPILAPIYFIAAIVTIYGVLLNLFLAIFLATYSEVKSSVYVRDTEVFQMLLKGFKNYFCFGQNKSELYIDKLLTKDEMPDPSQKYESQPNVEPMRDLREELAQLTERSFQIEKVLEIFASTIELISKLQDAIKKSGVENAKSISLGNS